MQHRRTAVIVTALALAGAACADGPGVTTGPTSTVAGPGPSTRTPRTDPRARIDPARYFHDYASGDYDVYSAGVPSMAVDQATGAMPAPEPRRPPEPVPTPGPLDDNTFVDAGESRWVAVADDRESTFALDVDTGSYRVAAAFLAEGYRPDRDSIRAEEWINAFRYGDAPAADGLAATVEAGTIGSRPTVRIGIATPELAAEQRPRANVTFVVDTSGSMDIRERLGLVQSSLAMLVRELGVDDTVSIVVYGSEAEPLLAPTRVAEWERIVAAIEELRPGGSTNMEAGLLLGYEQARAVFDPDAVNVVVLASDGVANVGVTDATVLTDQIAEAGRDGIHLVTVGYGLGNYNDHLMEQLADLGDGFYSYVDTLAEAERLFVHELTPTLTVVAAQAKVQVVFDDAVVARYRLIGYANRALDDAEFRDDTVDAGELGAGHQVSAVYELELVDGAAPGATAGAVRLRWAHPRTGAVTETETPIVVGGDATPGLRLAAAVGHTAEVLRGDEVVTARGQTLDTVLADAEALAASGVEGAGELAELIRAALRAQPVGGRGD